MCYHRHHQPQRGDTRNIADKTPGQKNPVGRSQTSWQKLPKCILSRIEFFNTMYGLGLDNITTISNLGLKMQGKYMIAEKELRKAGKVAGKPRKQRENHPPNGDN